MPAAATQEIALGVLDRLPQEASLGLAMLSEHYSTIVTLHSYWRWAVLLTALGAVGIAIFGLTQKAPFPPLGRRAAGAFVGAMDFQFLLGLILYCISPIVRAAWANMSVAMKQKELRFFSVEHTTFMLLALALAHVGAVRAKRAANDALAYQRMLIWHGAALLLILGGIPWWRPWLPGF